MPHLTQTIQRSLFETAMGPRPAAAYTPSADHEHGDANLAVRTAMTPLEVAPGVARLPGQCFCPGMSVVNLPPRKRGHHY